MGIFDNAIKKAEELGRKEVNELLLEGETINHFFMVKEDYCAMTDKRLIFIDKNFSGGKKAASGVPYNKISFVSLRKGGTFSISKEVIVTVGSKEIEIDLFDAAQALEIFKILSGRIC